MLFINRLRESPDAWLAAMPAIFVVLWSTGFVGAKFGLPYAPPGGFLFWRYVLVLVVLVPMIVVARAAWPSDRKQVAHLAVAGVLMQAGYLGGVFYAMDHGLSAGLAALVVGLQPVLTGVLAAPFLRERVSARQWLGLLLGLGGTALVLANKVSVTGLSGAAIGFGILGLLSITLGTLYQKRFCGNFDLRTGAFVQFAAALVVIAPFAALETRAIVWNTTLAATMLWLVVALSILSIGILAIMIRRGAATRVVSLFYLVPPVTALMGFVFFGETLTGLAMLGMAISVTGVALVVRQ